MVEEKERQNPDYQFLREKEHPHHLYYRWRLYAFLAGDDTENWNTRPFQWDGEGPFYLPPPPPRPRPPRSPSPSSRGTGRGRWGRTRGYSPESHTPKKSLVKKSEPMSEAIQEEIDDVLGSMSGSRHDILMAMGFLIQHTHCMDGVGQRICHYIMSPQSDSLSKKIAGLYLISDILHNSGTVTRAAAFREVFQHRLPSVFEYLRDTCKAITGRLTAKNVQERILKVIRAWESWGLYPSDFLRHLDCLFLLDPSKSSALVEERKEEREGDGARVVVQGDGGVSSPPSSQRSSPPRTEDPMEEEEDGEEDLDGVPVEVDVEIRLDSSSDEECPSPSPSPPSPLRSPSPSPSESEEEELDLFS